MQLIATRHYNDFDPKTGQSFELQDRLLRTGERSFVLMVAGELPGDPEVEQSFSLDGVFEWLRECPDQIERVVILGGRFNRAIHETPARACTGERSS